MNQGLILTAVTALLVVVGGHVVRSYKSEGIYSFVFLTRLFYFIFYVISAGAHLIGDRGFNVGYFDLVQYSGRVSATEVNLRSIGVVALGYVALVVAQFWGRSRYKGRDKRGTDFPDAEAMASDRYLLIAGLAFLIFGIYAISIIWPYISFVSVQRFQRLDAGAAKFVFISTWTAWGVTFLATYWIRRQPSASRISIALLVGMITISGCVYWTGGRIIAVLLCMPLFLSAAVLNRRAVNSFLPVAFVAFLIYAMALTVLRKQGYAVEETTLQQVLDWEYGRYSMVGYGIDYALRHGLLLGESWAAAVLSLVISPLQLLGVNTGNLAGTFSSTISLVGMDILGDPDLTYIVPGIVAEGYMNAGIFGVLAVVAISGLASVMVTRNFGAIFNRPALAILLFYIGALFCLNYLNSTSQSFLNYLFFNGFPLLLVAFVVEPFFKTRRSVQFERQR